MSASRRGSRVADGKIAGSVFTQEALVAILANPDYKYTIVPQNIMKYAEFMFRTGAMKSKPASWKDLFFPNVHDATGS